MENQTEQSGSVFKQRRVFGRVTPSGVKAEVYSLKGVDQADITINDETKRKKAINKMLFKSLKSLGDKNQSQLQLKDVEGLLEGDRKFLLWEIRMVSNQLGGDVFIFDWDFPVKDNQKRKQRYTVDYNRETFPFIPYEWVAKKMIADYKELNEITEELSEKEKETVFHTLEYPVMYDNYQDMLKDNLEQETMLPISGVKVYWKMLTESRREEMAGKLQMNLVSSHTPLQLRSPKYLDPVMEPKLADKELKDIIIPVPLDQLELNDIEALRLDINSKEARIETTLVVQYKDQQDSQTMIDLVNTSTFFFPSSAIM